MASKSEDDLKKFSDAANALNKYVADTVKTMPEAVFVSKLLPIIKEWVVDKKGDNVHLWAIAAGGIERPLIVTTNDGYFMVPPPYNHINTVNARSSDEVNKIHALNYLTRMKEQDGETREAMRLSRELENLLDIDENISTHAMYTVQLAKIWDRYGLPMEEVLSDLTLDLNRYDEYGRYLGVEKVEDKEYDESGEDELEW